MTTGSPGKVPRTGSRLLWELVVVGVVCVVFVALLVPALRSARREARDGMRRADVLEVKHELEDYFNQYERYPLEFDAGPYQYVVTRAEGNAARAWYIRAQLENSAAPEAAFDLEYNIYYRVVRDGAVTYYDICGGELHCGVPD